MLGMGWRDAAAETLWNDLVLLYETTLPEKTDSLTTLARDYPERETEIVATVNRIREVTTPDHTIDYKDAGAKKTNWTALVDEVDALLRDVPIEVQAQRDRIAQEEDRKAQLEVIHQKASDVLQGINSIAHKPHRETLFTDLERYREKTRNFGKDVRALIPGEMREESVGDLEKRGKALNTQSGTYQRRLDLIPMATEEPEPTALDQTNKNEKNLAALVGRGGVTDEQLGQLLPHYGAAKLKDLLALASPTEVLRRIRKDGISAGLLYRLYRALDSPGEDALIKRLFKTSPKGQEEQLVELISRSNGDEGGYLEPLLGETDPATLLKMIAPKQGSLEDANTLLVTAPALAPADVQGRLAANGRDHAVPCLLIEKDIAFLTAFDAAGMSRRTMLDHLQMLAQTPGKLAAFVAFVTAPPGKDATQIQQHLNLRSVNVAGKTQIWPSKTRNSFTGDEQVQVSATLAAIPGGVAPAMPRHAGAAGPIKFGVNWYNQHGDLDGPKNVAGNFREYYVQKPEGEIEHGKRRIVQRIAGGDLYYSRDHYDNFVRIE